MVQGSVIVLFMLQAKERELDLQKHWAVGSQARKDSRSKYGF
jgi:hypothetical protein